MVTYSNKIDESVNYSQQRSRTFQMTSFFTRQPLPAPFLTQPFSRALAISSSLSSVVAKRISIFRACKHSTPPGPSHSSCSSAAAGTCVMSALGLPARIVRSLQGGVLATFCDVCAVHAVCEEGTIFWMVAFSDRLLLDCVGMYSLFSAIGSHGFLITSY